MYNNQISKLKLLNQKRNTDRFKDIVTQILCLRIQIHFICQKSTYRYV